MIIGIDQSFKNNAFCIFNNLGELVDFDVIKSKKVTDDTSYEERILEITEALFEKLERHNIRHISLEGLSMAKNSITARPLAGLFYYLCIEFKKRGISYSVIPPTTVKKFAVKGNAKKEEMFEVLPQDIKEQFLERGFKKTTGLFDLTDAYFIGKYTLRHGI